MTSSLRILGLTVHVQHEILCYSTPSALNGSWKLKWGPSLHKSTQSLGRDIQPFTQYLHWFLDQQYAVPFFMVVFSVEYHTLDAHCMYM